MATPPNNTRIARIPPGPLQPWTMKHATSVAILLMDEFLYHCETRVETRPFVGIYVGGSNHPWVSEGCVAWISRPSVARLNWNLEVDLKIEDPGGSILGCPWNSGTRVPLLIDGDSWFTWWLNHPPSPSISPTRTPYAFLLARQGSTVHSTREDWPCPP